MIKNEQAGLYIHIPFCLSKCAYCSFYSIAAPNLIPEFIKALLREMAFWKSSSLPGQGFDTIYLGGGTPSLLLGGQIQEIMNAVNSAFVIDRQAEVTMELNPGNVSPEYLRNLRAWGVNRLNIGVQSFDDGILKFLGRRHSAREAVCAIDAARAAGFYNIGLDLIYGISGQDIRLWTETLERALSFVPEHLSCYQLSVEAQTPLFGRYRSEGLSLPAESEALDFFFATSHRLAEAGYRHYEVSNFARGNSFRSRHNMKYWRHIPYLGLGPSAHSFCAGRRWWNTADVAAYIQNLSEGKTPVRQSEELSAEQLALEALFLGLRTQDGIDLEQYQALYGVDLLTAKKQTLGQLVENGLVEIRDGRLSPTLSGLAVADSLALI